MTDRKIKGTGEERYARIDVDKNKKMARDIYSFLKIKSSPRTMRNLVGEKERGRRGKEKNERGKDE